MANWRDWKDDLLARHDAEPVPALDSIVRIMRSPTALKLFEALMFGPAAAADRTEAFLARHGLPAPERYDAKAQLKTFERMAEDGVTRLPSREDPSYLEFDERMRGLVGPVGEEPDTRCRTAFTLSIASMYQVAQHRRIDVRGQVICARVHPEPLTVTHARYGVRPDEGIPLRHGERPPPPALPLVLTDRDGGRWWLEGWKTARARRDLWKQTRTLEITIGREGEPACYAGVIQVPARASSPTRSTASASIPGCPRRSSGSPELSWLSWFFVQMGMGSPSPPCGPRRAAGPAPGRDSTRRQGQDAAQIPQADQAKGAEPDDAEPLNSGSAPRTSRSPSPRPNGTELGLCGLRRATAPTGRRPRHPRTDGVLLDCSRNGDAEPGGRLLDAGYEPWLLDCAAAAACPTTGPRPLHLRRRGALRHPRGCGARPRNDSRRRPLQVVATASGALCLSLSMAAGLVTGLRRRRAGRLPHPKMSWKTRCACTSAAKTPAVAPSSTSPRLPQGGPLVEALPDLAEVSLGAECKDPTLPDLHNDSWGVGGSLFEHENLDTRTHDRLAELYGTVPCGSSRTCGRSKLATR
ncbi:hypothetical protein GCM10020221_32200 [Streptomyces thioluteus]|uniref:Transposase n=1 Tax=Streptomyces thioluteus TaxID=66431 RepID=A0ABP6JIZ1_STRTU